MSQCLAANGNTIALADAVLRFQFSSYNLIQLFLPPPPSESSEY